MGVFILPSLDDPDRIWLVWYSVGQVEAARVSGREGGRRVEQVTLQGAAVSWGRFELAADSEVVHRRCLEAGRLAWGLA